MILRTNGTNSKKDELLVLTKARELSQYLFLIMEKAPKKYRFTLSTRIQNTSLDILSQINRANEVFIDLKLLKDLDRSIKPMTERIEISSDMEKYNLQNRLLSLKLARATTFEQRMSKRVDLQHEALANLKELDHLLTMAKEFGAVLPKQFDKATELIWEVRNLVGAWINSDRHRYHY